jgi:hypothetical protein
MKKLLLLIFFITFGLLTHVGLNGQTLKHSYTFEDGTYDLVNKVVNDQVGTVNGTINGQGMVFKNGAVTNTYGTRGSNGYISFRGAALALNTYSALTLEFYLTATADAATRHWAVLSYFGGNSGAKSFSTNAITNDNPSRSRAILNGAAGTIAYSSSAAAYTTHHYVAVLTPSTASTAGSVAWYVDGTLAMSTALAAGSYDNAVSAIDTTNAFLFRSGWNDPNWTGTIHEFNIYDGIMDAATVALRSKMYNIQLSSLTVTAGTIKPAFTSGIYKYALTVPDGTTSIDVAAVASQSTKTVKGTGTIDVSGTSGVISVSIDSAGAMPYTIYWSKPITSATLVNSYTFTDGTAKDVVGGADGNLVGTKNAIANGAYTATSGGNLNAGTSNHIVLPGKIINLGQYPSFTMEAYELAKANNFISYFGSQVSWGVNYFFMQCNNSDISCNYYFNPWSGATSVSAGSNIDGKGHHIVTVVAEDTMYVYRDGVFSAKKVLGTGNKYFNITNDTAYLGRSGYTGDNNFVGSISEYNIYKGALDTATIRTRSIAYHNSDAFLTGLTLSTGTLSPAFSLANTSYTAIMPIGSTTSLLGATVSNALATVADTGTVDYSSGTAVRNVVVTAPDGITKTTTTINFRYASTDSTLSNLTVDGTTVTGFASNVYTYEVKLAGGTTIVPTVIGTANFSGATVVVTPATVLPGSTTILVTAENGTSKTTYTVNFTFLDPTLLLSPAGLTIEDLSPQDSITVSAANLTSDITITAPVGITVNPASISAAATISRKVYVTYVGTALVNDSIVFTSGTLVKKVGIKTVSNAACFTPLYASGNLVTNPYFNGLTGFGGWGSRSISTSPDSVYCGTKSGKITGKCGGSMDVSFAPLKSNSVYRLKAAVLTMGGSFKIGMNNIGTGVPNYVANFDTYGKWKIIDTTVVTGDNTTCNAMWFNSCESQTGTIGYIDNWEMYDITPYATLSDLTVNGATVAGFDSTVFTYNVVSPTVPTVAATAAVTGATVNITQAIAIPGTATVQVISADGKATLTYTINFTAVSTDATLSALAVDAGTLSPVFNSATLTYYVQLASGSAIPTVTPTANDAGATLVVTPATAIPDTTIIKVTAEDGTTTKTYMVNFWDLKLTGTIIGHSSSWGDDPTHYIAAAFDGNTSTFVDAPTATGYVGLDLGTNKAAKITSMRYFPRSGYTARMVGGEIRGANNADLSDAVVLYTISTEPTLNYTDVLLSVANSYRYIYYYSASGYCNIAELELYGVTTTTNIEIVKNVFARVIPTISSDNFKVEFVNKLGIISVYDISGRLISNKIATKSSEEISVPTKGIYLIKIKVGNDVKTFKVVKVD